MAADNILYAGSFQSRDGKAYVVKITKDTEENVPWQGIDFDAEPMTIEWSSKEKYDPVCTSTLTLRPISPEDRTFIGLCAEAPGAIKIEVLCNGSLFWTGTLDTEEYEEPYERTRNYEVELTFTDFGILNRIPFDLPKTEHASIREIIRQCMAKAHIITYDHSTIDTHISTEMQEGVPLTLDDVYVDCANFYDEEGEPMTWMEVLEGVLQPFGLRIIHKNGHVTVYDLNAMAQTEDDTEVYWSADSQRLGMEKTYNNVRVSYSTYARSGDQMPCSIWPEDIKVDKTYNEYALTNVRPNDIYSNLAVKTVLGNGPTDASEPGFTLWMTIHSPLLKDMSEGVWVSKLVSQASGSDSEGVLVMGDYYKLVNGQPDVHSFMRGPINTYSVFPDTYRDYAALGTPYYRRQNMIAEFNSLYIPGIQSPGSMQLRLSIPLLIDARFNPFEDIPDNAFYKQLQTKGNEKLKEMSFVIVPVMLKFIPTNGGDVLYWTNKPVLSTAPSNPAQLLYRTYGEWVAQPNIGYLAWYDTDEKREGVMGSGNFVTNRPAINFHKKKLNGALANVDGQYIPYPGDANQPGLLEITIIGTNWAFVKPGQVYNEENHGFFWDCCDNAVALRLAMENSEHSQTPFIFIGTPKLEIQNRIRFGEEIDTSDVEYSAEVNATATDELSINTIVGTKKGGVPAARGAIFDATGQQLTSFYRAGRQSQLEDLLIGTLYSQYAERHTRISGEARYIPDFGVVTEANQPGKKFIITSEVASPISGTSEIVISEISPDNYTPNGN